MKKMILLLLGILLAAAVAGVLYWRYLRPGADQGRDARVLAFLRAPQEHADWVTPAGVRCPGAPFSMPSSGFIGYLWDDSFRVGHRHQGIDIFAGTEPGVTPVYAAFSGYLTRKSDWKSTVVIRVPDDPLAPGRQIWTYYTHMADAQGNPLIAPDFPAGTAEVYVEAGTLLGWQGNYSGTPGAPVGVHLHFSIVRDVAGQIANELEIANTYDPSPYLGLPLNAASNPELPIQCGE